jgi:hypothetical protein
MSDDFMDRIDQEALETTLKGIRDEGTIIEYSPEYYEELTGKAAEVFGIDRSEVTEIHRKAVHFLGNDAADLKDRLLE